MTIEMCYEEMGGNCQEVCMRIPSDTLIIKFVGSFLDDPSFATLRCAMDAGNLEEAFRAAHTLKGVCANLSFSKLQHSASQLTEVLRAAQDAIPEQAYALMEAVCRDYQDTTDVIRKFQAEA